MDDRNGDCFDHPEAYYNPINTLESEHDCLKEFLLEPDSSSRNVPCSTGPSDIFRNSLDSHLLPVPQNNFAIDNVYMNCGAPLNTVVHPASLSNNLTNNCPDIYNISGQVSADYVSPPVDLLLPPSNSCDRNGEFSAYGASSAVISHPPPPPTVPPQLAPDKFVGDEFRDWCENVSPVQKCVPSESESTKCLENDVENHKLNFGDLEPSSVGAAEDQVLQRVDCFEPLPVSTNEVKTKHSSRGKKRRGGEGTATRGRPVGSVKRKKEPVTTYQSQISPDQNGIKLRIKKSSSSSVSKTVRRNRKRRTKKNSNSDEDEDIDDELETKKLKHRQEEEELCDASDDEPNEQSRWALDLPCDVLYKIFGLVIEDEGCLPFLVRVSRVCRMWYNVAVMPGLWHNIDLTGPWVKDRYKSEAQLNWLFLNRLTQVNELNVGGWKLSGIQGVIDTMVESCQNLRGLCFAGWTGLSAEHMKILVSHFTDLSHIDLSGISPENNNGKSAVSILSVTTVCETLGENLTHLVLANNRIKGLHVIITAIASHCPNLELLDISNIRAHSNPPISIEKLQTGCQKLRVLRMSNSQVCLGPASLKEQVASPGFPNLEELSVAGIGGPNGLGSYPVIDDCAVERILKTSHKLRLLDVRGCSRISDSSLVRVPAWDVEHLFLSGCYVTRMATSGLELIVQKWSHSLIELDLAWSSATEPLDTAVHTLAEQAGNSKLRVLNLCGSSVSLEPVKAVLMQCPYLMSLNLSSCRALPRGMKRLYEGMELADLRNSFEDKQETSSANENQVQEQKEAIVTPPNSNVQVEDDDQDENDEDEGRNNIN